LIIVKDSGESGRMDRPVSRGVKVAFLASLADIFERCYRVGGSGVDFAGIRLHATGAERACRALHARAFTLGSDIYFGEGAFAPHTRAGLRLLAHEVAHVVQQQCGTVDTVPAGPGFAVAPPGSCHERAADAAAVALLTGRPFVFAGASRPGEAGPQRTVQRYMAWEHALLGDLDPVPISAAATGPAGNGPGREHIEAYYALLELLGRDPLEVYEERLRAEYPDLETVRLPGSGLVVTLGELNVLPDYLAGPADIETAPAAFLGPLIQSVRSWSIAELRRSAGHPAPPRRLRGSLRYPLLRSWLAEAGEVLAVDALGRRCGFAPPDLYSSVLARNAGHFAPFSWHRWQSFHLMARDLITRSRTAGEGERAELRARARIYAGYADHFLQDSYAAGHLINKTLVMQWYVEWLAESRIPYRDQNELAGLTVSRQPALHGPEHYSSTAGPRAALRPPWDPQRAAEAPTLAERIEASGVMGRTEPERREAYHAYLAMLGSTVAQFAVGVVHGHLNKRSLVVAAGQDGQRFRLHGDRTLLAGPTGAQRAAEAARTSRRAISELLSRGETDITSREIFDAFPDHVEWDDELISLPQWHAGGLRDLCFGELFRRPGTRAMRIFLSAVPRRLGAPSADPKP
jgi:hypothetical protein